MKIWRGKSTSWQTQWFRAFFIDGRVHSHTLWMNTRKVLRPSFPLSRRANKTELWWACIHPLRHWQNTGLCSGGWVARSLFGDRTKNIDLCKRMRLKTSSWTGPLPLWNQQHRKLLQTYFMPFKVHAKKSQISIEWLCYNHELLKL